MNRTIILALSLAVVLLAATASTASADRVTGTWNCPPLPPAPSYPIEDPQIQRCFGPSGSFDFGYHRPGTSASQRFALGVYDNDTFSPTIGVSGDYAQTNNCPPTLSAPAGRVQGCIIDVTFTPTGKGPRPGTLTTGPGGPTVALTGGGEDAKGPPDLRLSGAKSRTPRRTGPYATKVSAT
jgi:opacity protein-like surface antigen